MRRGWYVKTVQLAIQNTCTRHQQVAVVCTPQSDNELQYSTIGQGRRWSVPVLDLVHSWMQLLPSLLPLAANYVQPVIHIIEIKTVIILQEFLDLANLLTQSSAQCTCILHCGLYSFMHQRQLYCMCFHFNWRTWHSWPTLVPVNCENFTQYWLVGSLTMQTNSVNQLPFAPLVICMLNIRCSIYSMTAWVWLNIV